MIDWNASLRYLPEEYFADIALAYQAEIKALYEAGCRESLE